MLIHRLDLSGDVADGGAVGGAEGYGILRVLAALLGDRYQLSVELLAVWGEMSLAVAVRAKRNTGPRSVAAQHSKDVVDVDETSEVPFRTATGTLAGVIAIGQDGAPNFLIPHHTGNELQMLYGAIAAKQFWIV